MRIGFTGSRGGMTLAQKMAFRQLVAGGIGDFHHGDCVGADAEAHDIMNPGWWNIIIHPPIGSSLRAFKQGDEMRKCRPYMERNRDIVDECEWLIATPRETIEQRQSGTWATVRYAVKCGRKVTVIQPDGKLVSR